MAAMVLAPVLTLATAATVMVSPLSVAAQANAAPASIHGVVTNAAGQPVKDGVIKLTTDRSTTRRRQAQIRVHLPGRRRRHLQRR